MSSKNFSKLVEDIRGRLQESANNPAVLEVAIKECGQQIRIMRAALKDVKSVGQKQHILSCIGQIDGMRTVMKSQRTIVGSGYTPIHPNRQNWASMRVKWLDQQSAFASRLRTAIIVNLIHKEPATFLDDCADLFRRRVCNMLKKEAALKVNASFCGEFVIVKGGVELRELKHIATKNYPIYRDTDLAVWFKENIQETILTQLEEFQGSYKAAVVEYAAISEAFIDPEDILRYNTEEYVKFIEKAAAQGTQIIVFPEDGLTTVIIASKTPEQVISYSIELPDLAHKPNPCNNESLHKVLRLISCAARDGSIYVVFNLLERVKEGGSYIFYNTNLVIDRNGTMITKYRKINLYTEPNFRRGNELVTFKTDFGVTFGVIICADILYKRPALEVIRQENVTDVIFSTAWFSETPYLQALSVQAGYARATGVNLLAAGLNDPENKNGGSGIYLFDGRIAEIYISPAKSSKLLIQNVPKSDLKLSAEKCNNNSHENPGFRLGGNLNAGHFTTFSENMTGHTLLTLNKQGLETKVTLCNYNGIYCCKFHVVLDKQLTSADPRYRLSLYYGIRRVGDTTAGVRSCGLIACRNEDKNSCGQYINRTMTNVKFSKISIQGNFDESSETYDQPVTLTYDLTPITAYTYCETISHDKKRVQADMITTQPLTNIFSFGIHGRMFEYDGMAPGVITNSAIRMGINLLLGMLFLPILFG